MSDGIMEGMFSWLNDFLSWLVSLGMEGKLNWIEQSWPVLVVIIAVFCVGMDIALWIIRCRPDKDWRRVALALFGGRAPRRGDDAKEARINGAKRKPEKPVPKSSPPSEREKRPISDTVQFRPVQKPMIIKPNKNAGDDPPTR